MAENALTPDKTINYRVYKDGVNLLGIATVDLPELSFMADTLSGAGIAGEIETSVKGQLQAMSATIHWNTVTQENLKLLELDGAELTFRASQQYVDQANNRLIPKGLKIVTKGITKTMGLGTLEVGVKNDSSYEYELTYLKIEMEGKETVEIDKFNFIFKIDGKDILSDVRTHIGM